MSEPTASFGLIQPLDLDGSAELPLWFRAAQSLRLAIGECPGGTVVRLPNEASLAGQLGVSIATVRRALAVLEGDGLITRHRRRGTHTTGSRERTRELRLLGSVDAFMLQQTSERAEILARSIVAADGDLARHYPGAQQLQQITRLRFDGGEPASFAVNWLRCEHADRISDEMLRNESMTRILRDRLGISLGQFRNEVEAQLVEEDVAGHLEVAPSSPVLVSHNSTRDQSGAVVDLARIYYRADRFKFSVNVNIA